MTKDQKISIEKAYAKGVDHFNGGDLKQALGVFSMLVRQAPRHAPSHHMLGLIAFRNGQLEPAIKALSVATSLAPQNSGFAANFTEVLRKAERVDDALKVGKLAVKIDPSNAAAHSNLGLVFYDKGDLDEAEASQRRALALGPDFAPALNNLASITRDRGELDQAIDLYRQTIDANPLYNEAANNLTSALIEAERFDEAQALVQSRKKVQQKDAEFQRNVGRISLVFQDFDLAEASFRNAIALDEQDADGYVGLGQSLFEKNHSQLALLEIEKALRLDPVNANAHHHLGTIRSKMGDLEGGLTSHRKALELNDKLTGSQIAIGHLLVEQGEFDQARVVFEQSAKDAKDANSAHIAIARLDKMTSAHPSFTALKAAATDVDKMPAARAVALHYALGKSYEDISQFDTAFMHFDNGARQKRGIVQYDPKENDQQTQSLIDTFSKSFISNLKKSSISSDTPIFVLGMPRSGTTLTEAILNAHPLVFGAGELPDLQAIFGPPPGQPRSKLGSVIAERPADESRRLAKKYVTELCKHAPQSDKIVDKMPANFQLLGLISALMPRAKIIHVARNPIDTCLSNYTRVFERSQLHSYDQVELGRYFNNYVELMNHWYDVLDVGSFYTLHYEDLVDDIDEQARSLIEYCGLEWDDRCLEFYKGKRRVRTASLQQVRQPLYSSSKQKWRKYSNHLTPLIETIGERRIAFSGSN